MKILNYTQFLKEDNPILFTGQSDVGNTSSHDNIFVPGQTSVIKRKIKGKKVKTPSRAVIQPPMSNPQSYVNRLLQ